MPEKNFGSLRSAKSSPKFFFNCFTSHGCPNYRPRLGPEMGIYFYRIYIFCMDMGWPQNSSSSYFMEMSLLHDFFV